MDKLMDGMDVGVHWVELFPSVKLKNGYVDKKMPPEPTLKNFKLSIKAFKMWNDDIFLSN